jgi:hypothetical protein
MRFAAEECREQRVYCGEEAVVCGLIPAERENQPCSATPTMKIDSTTARTDVGDRWPVNHTHGD